MTSGFGDLNGSGNQQVWVNVWRTGQSGNQSNYAYEVRYYGNGWGSYTSSALYWSFSNPYHSSSGSFTIPYANRNDTYTVLKAGTFSQTHNSAGYGAAFNSTASIDASAHSSIGSGSVTVPEETPPRIPKPPAAPAAPTFSEVRTDNIRVTIPPPDNMGAPITGYDFQRATDAAFTQGVATVAHNGHILDIGNLTPGTTYWFRGRAKNSAGTGAWSPIAPQATLTALYFIDPETDVAEAVALFFWNGSTYEPVQLLIDPELDGTFVPAG